MIKGTGIDIVEISRIQKSLNNEKFIIEFSHNKNKHIAIIAIY